MKSIILHAGSSEDSLFDVNMRDNCNEPFIYLKERLRFAGYDFVTTHNGNIAKCDWVFFIDSPFTKNLGPIPGSTEFFQKCIDAGLKDKLVLFLWEGKSVIEANYLPSVHEKFKYIFTWCDTYVDNQKFFKFYLPITTMMKTTPLIPFNQKKLLVNISRNNFSRYKNELYSARRKSIKYFSKYFPNDFDLFGFGWNQPATRLERLLWERLSLHKLFPFLIEKFSSYRGSVPNKSEVLSHYKFSLCYENLKDEPGYVTEKIFDCLKAHTVPIYWGASNIEKYIDQEAFIDRRLFHTEKELADFISTMTENKYNEYMSAGKRYLRSQEYKLFLPENFAGTIIDTLHL